MNPLNKPKKQTRAAGRALCWIRRDLRLHDHHALSAALKNYQATFLVFVFDPHILDQVATARDKRVTFIEDSLKELEKKVREFGSRLFILYGKPWEEIPRLAQALGAHALFYNRDYEPYAQQRDFQVTEKVRKMGLEVKSFKDHVVFEKDEIKTGSGEIYKVFTPFWRKWMEQVEFLEMGGAVPSYPCPLKYLGKVRSREFPAFAGQDILSGDWMKEVKIQRDPPPYPGGTSFGMKRLRTFAGQIASYKVGREDLFREGSSQLGVYLRHGNLSVRDLLRLSLSGKSEGHQDWLRQLVWREFFITILASCPYVADQPFKKIYKGFPWSRSKVRFEKWCQGQTGYPIVDAAMRCLNQTGLMANRLRLVTASFFCKILLLDWRWGEQYFARRLLDYDMAANNGGWQWSSSTGCDAQPYFRIFNPYLQSEKYDPEGKFIKKYCPELGGLSGKALHRPPFSFLAEMDYPQPIVDYEKARHTALDLFTSWRA